MAYDGLSQDIGSLFRLSPAQSRSLSAENPDGAKGGGARAEVTDPRSAARDLGRGWKVRPCISIPAGTTAVIADVDGPGAIQQIWMTPSNPWRFLILRIWWDGQEHPAVECPLGDFFACGWNRYSQLSSLAVCVNPGSAFNCYWTMPFRKHCRMTVENISSDALTLFYQVNYTLTEVPADAAYFHARFQRTNPMPQREVHTILDISGGAGHFVGTALAWGSRSTGWWGEGEIKFHIDGDGEFPTICGTGTEDYFCGSYNFENQTTHQYQEFTTPYAGLHQVIRPDGVYQSQTRFSMYRWHITDPVRFSKDLRVTIQALGWRSGGRFLPLQDDLASVAFWYQAGKTPKPPALPGRDGLEVN